MNKAPSHLLASTRTWWASIAEAYLLEDHHFRLLLGCCEAWDRAETARRAVKRDGMFHTDRFGAPRLHPGVDAERKSRDQFRLLLRELGLDVESTPNETRAPIAPGNVHLRVEK